MRPERINLEVGSTLDTGLCGAHDVHASGSTHSLTYYCFCSKKLVLSGPGTRTYGIRATGECTISDAVSRVEECRRRVLRLRQCSTCRSCLI